MACDIVKPQFHMCETAGQSKIGNLTWHLGHRTVEVSRTAVSSFNTVDA
jgi:hypothetical protein